MDTIGPQTMAPQSAASLPGAGRARWLRLDPLWLAAPGIAFLFFFMAFPTLRLLSLSALDQAGSLTLAPFERVLNGRAYTTVLSTTFAVAASTTILALAFGYPLAFWLSTKELRSQRVAMLFVLLPFWTSALIKNFAWMVLLGRNGVTAKIMAALGLPGGDALLFNRGTVVFAMTHTLLPLAVVTMLPVMNQIDRRLTMAAGTLGANRAQAFWRVYFQLSMRGLAAAGLLVFVVALGFFVTPALVGGPRETMVGQAIILQINDLQNWQVGSALAAILLVTAVATCFVYDRIFGLSSIAEAGGKAADPNALSRRAGLAVTRALGTLFAAIEQWWGAHVRGVSGRTVLAVYCWMVIGALLLPIVAFVPMAFTGSTFLSFPPEGVSLRWFEAYATSPQWVGATLRSFGIGLTTAALTLLVTVPAALGVVRSPSRFAPVVFLIFLTPMILPSLVIAIALFYLFARMSLVATDLGIVLGHMVIAMPIVFVILLTTFKGHDWRLDSAAATLGASRGKVLRYVTFPLVKGGLVVGFVTGFLQSFEELTVALFVSGGLKTTLPKQMWDGILLQVSPVIAAAAVVVLVIVVLLFALMELFQSRTRARE